MKLRSFVATGCLWASSSAVVLAHPGHGSTEPNGLAHWIAEPLHAAPLVAVMIGIATWAVWRNQRSTARHSAN